MVRALVMALAILLPAAAGADVPRRQIEAVVASWYGAAFHGRPTASGSRFDRQAATAAHRTLPFGARLRVIDLRTGRAEVVTITDRGPFIAGRDLDLSEGTAVRIGLRARGVGPVLIERLR